MKCGTIAIGDFEVCRLGFGTMRLVGPGVIGPPRDVAAARETLRLLPELGVNLVDTANSYGPLLAEWLVRAVLHPYRGLLVATKGGLLRPGPNQWQTDGRPEALRAAVKGSLATLGVERLDLWQLHRIDPEVPADEQFAAIAEMQRDGLIRHVGLSNVSGEHIEAAGKHFTVAAVQNLYHVIDRRSEPVVEYCEQHGIPFLAYFPLATGALAAHDSILQHVAGKIGITPGQAALAWLLKRSPSIIAIPGTQNPEHLHENVAAASIELSDEQYAEIERIGRKADQLRAQRR
ncbi:MAG TPA: aldo/keto reductase [Kofleriaceae bacterium]|jgi:aryl-alcohol dehydrogenase-like predicted oxidoreductase|nr:aldo/keto reductase [Kofleriaceae bacterium]